MIDLTEITETISSERYERVRAKYPEENFPAWEALDAPAKTRYKQQMVALISRIAEVTERQVREQIAVEIRALPRTRANLLTLDDAMKIVRGGQ